MNTSNLTAVNSLDSLKGLLIRLMELEKSGSCLDDRLLSSLPNDEHCSPPIDTIGVWSWASDEDGNLKYLLRGDGSLRDWFIEDVDSEEEIFGGEYYYDNMI